MKANISRVPFSLSHPACLSSAVGWQPFIIQADFQLRVFLQPEETVRFSGFILAWDSPGCRVLLWQPCIPWEKTILTMRTEPLIQRLKTRFHKERRGKIVRGSKWVTLKGKKPYLLTAHPNCVRISSNVKGKDTWMAVSWEPRMREDNPITVVVNVVAELEVSIIFIVNYQILCTGNVAYIMNIRPLIEQGMDNFSFKCDRESPWHLRNWICDYSTFDRDLQIPGLSWWFQW